MSPDHESLSKDISKLEAENLNQWSRIDDHSKNINQMEGAVSFAKWLLPFLVIVLSLFTSFLTVYFSR